MAAFERHPDQPDKSDLRTVDGVTVRSMHFRHAGMVLPQHAHAYEHLTVVASGAVRAWADGRLLGEFAAPETLTIPPFVKHRFETLMPATTLLCIHNAERAGCAGCAGCIDDVPVAAEHYLDGVA